MLATIKPDTVILHATWPAYYQANPQAFKAALTKTLDWFATQKVRVYLIGDTPGASANVPIGLAKKIAYNVPFELVRTVDYERTHEAVSALLRAEAHARGFIYLDTASALCVRNGYCEVELNDHPLYWDSAHLSGYGSRLVASNLARSGGILFSGGANTAPAAPAAAPVVPVAARATAEQVNPRNGYIAYAAKVNGMPRTYVSNVP